MTHRCTNDFKFLASVSYRLAPTGHIQRLADPFGNRHVARARHTLNFPVVGIPHNDLQPFSHMVSLSDSWI